MGNWTKYEFGRDKLPNRCYLFAGDVPEERKNSMLSFYEKVEFHKHTVYERYIVSNGSKEDLLLFQVYGASTISDLSYILKDGGVEEIIFIGSAYGIKKGIEIGSYIIPNNVQALDGLLKIVYNADYSRPNELVTENIKRALDVYGEKYIEGKSVSVPSTFFQPAKEKLDIDTIALEMEFSAICYLSEKLGMNCGGVLIISDNEDHTLLDDRTLLYKNWVNLFKILKKYFDET
jgi:Purine-nucleoside phosphorylase